MATIAEERAANARAQAEGYANAASKEMHANTQSQTAGFSNAVAQEIDANKRAVAAGFRNAAEQEMDANRRSREAGFTNAVDQEIDANRRAREAGYLNAANLETYGSQGATRSTKPFLDPRLQQAPAIPPKFALGGGTASSGLWSDGNLFRAWAQQNPPPQNGNWNLSFGMPGSGNPLFSWGQTGGPMTPQSGGLISNGEKQSGYLRWLLGQTA